VSNQDFIDFIRDERGIYVHSQDLRELQIELFNKTQRSRLLPYYCFEVKADVGKGLLILGGALLGGFFLPGLLAGVGGSSIGWVSGALLGASIGYKLANLSSSGGSNAPTIKEQSVFGFGNGFDLVELNAPVPVIYCNDANNSYLNTDGVLEGGLYVPASTIYTRIAPATGTQILTKLSVIGGGVLGEVDLSKMLLNSQPRSDFGSLDVAVDRSNGSATQFALAGIGDYCQAVSPNSNNFLGVGSGLIINRVNYAADVIITAQDFYNTTVSPQRQISKIGGSNAWDGRARSQAFLLSGTYGDFIEYSCRISNLGTLKAIGISANNSTPNPANMDFAVIFRADNKYEVWLLGIIVLTSTNNYNLSQKFHLRFYNGFPTNYFQLLVDETEVYRTATTVTGYVFGDYALFDLSATLSELFYRIGSRANDLPSNLITADILPGLGKRFVMSADVMDKFKTGTQYNSNTAGSVQIVAKNSTASWIEIDRELWLAETPIQIPLPGSGAAADTRLYPRYTSLFSTTKAVNKIELVVLANLDARDKDGNLQPFGVAFKLEMNDANGWQTIGESIIVARSASQLYRSITVANLPKKIYQIRITPLIPIEIANPLNSIGESGNVQNFTSSADFGSGSVIWSFDVGTVYSPADAAQITDVNQRGKVRTSADQGAPAKITHVNEIVSSSTPPTYPGFTIIHTKIQASDRIQSDPQILHDVRKGRPCRNYLAAGIATSTSGVDNVDDVGAHFIDDGVAIGCTVRVLEQGWQRVVTALTQNSLTCSQYTISVAQGTKSHFLTLSGINSSLLVGMPISGVGIPPKAFIEKISGVNLTIGDGWGRLMPCAVVGSIPAIANGNLSIANGNRYVVWSIDSSNYLPDVALDRLLNTSDGLGGVVDQDWFVHYPSFVRSRKFCVLNKYFFDGVVNSGGWEQWLTETAASSLLFPTKIDGQYALIPEQNERVKGIFNAANLIDYSEPYTEWQNQATNTVYVKYADKRGRAQQKRIQTIAASNGSEVEISKTIDLKGVTNPAQAIDVGCVTLKSLRAQNRVCKFSTDFANLTCMQGDIIRTQHATIEYENEKSGWVMATQPLTNPRVEIGGAIAKIAKTLPAGGATTLIYCDRPHGLVDGNIVVITGHSASGLNSTQAVDVYDDCRFAIPIGYQAGTGGNVAKQRTVFDQRVKLSESLTIDLNSRISIGHKLSTKCELDLQLIINIDETITIVGLEQSTEIGDLFMVGAQSILDRTWRIASLKPMMMDNKAEIVGLVWDADILSKSGLIIS
jgi:Putative phage tail protein